MAGERRAPLAGDARTVAALTAKYLADVARSPAMLVSMLLPLAMLMALRAIMGPQIELPEQDRVFASSIAAYAVLFECVMVTSMVILYAMAEEREKHLLRTLMLADVRLGHVVLARGIVATACVAVANTLCLAGLGADAGVLGPLVAMSVVGSLPLVLMSLSLGLFARNQMSVMVLDTPLVLAAVLPMFFVYDDSLARATPLLPTGGLYDLTLLMWSGGSPLSPEALVPSAMLLAWIAAMALTLAVALRKAPREA